MYAYRNALRLGVDELETDAALSADGIPVLIHDSTLQRTTNCSGQVNSKTFAELRACNAGWWWTPGQGTTSPDASKPHPLRKLGIHIPAAEELFTVVRKLGPADRHTINIEIKDVNFIPLARALVPIIQRSGVKERTIVQSFYPPALDFVKLLDSSITTSLLTEGATTPYLAYSLAGRHDWVSPSSSDVDLSASVVSLAHAAGKKVIPWTLDSKAAQLSTGQMGVDAIITNYPACLLALEGRALPKSLLPAESIKAGSGPVKACADQ